MENKIDIIKNELSSKINDEFILTNNGQKYEFTLFYDENSFMEYNLLLFYHIFNKHIPNEKLTLFLYDKKRKQIISTLKTKDDFLWFLKHFCKYYEIYIFLNKEIFEIISNNKEINKPIFKQYNKIHIKYKYGIQNIHYIYEKNKIYALFEHIYNEMYNIVDVVVDIENENLASIYFNVK